VRSQPFKPTAEQKKIIEHATSAFVEACPGAGKTRTMVERARILLAEKKDRRAVAFLSFTTAAVDELETRLRTFGVLPTPLYPSFIGTFDRFLWQFLIAPFGVAGSSARPRLVPDKSEWDVIPFEGAQALPLRCFDRAAGKIDPEKANGEGFDITKRPFKSYETMALAIINRSRSEGRIDFEDVRDCVRERLADKDFAKRLGAALAGRFREIVIDEAQDCNPDDLDIVAWLQDAGITVKVICDPNQSIYEFRGGVTDQLLKFGEKFAGEDRLLMSGNFRSTPAICAAISMLRPPASRGAADTPLGQHKADTTPVHILSYGGSGVPSTIGAKFRELVEAMKLPLDRAPVLAATRGGGGRAIGQPTVTPGNNRTLLLADAVMNYHFSFAVGDRREALVNLHRVLLLLQGHIFSLGSYFTYLEAHGMDDGRWRADVIALANRFRFVPPETADAWLDRVRDALVPTLVGTGTIKQRLHADKDLAKALGGTPMSSATARTIHSAKGMEFPAVCVVLTTRTAGGILDLLEGKDLSTSKTPIAEIEEDARKIYVAASRAERLLVKRD
jgi:DNA helicase II / ATP-dependent DNA helicase PcrA